VTDSTAQTDTPAAKADQSDNAASPPERTPEQIQSDIDDAQKRLADHVDVLSERLAPQALAEEAIESVKRVFVDDDGTPKKKPIAIAAGAVAGLLVLRKIFHR
jgi:F0F1-type ATP synthase membrane subunit b/b'